MPTKLTHIEKNAGESLTKTLAGKPENYPKPQEGIWLTLSPNGSDADCKTVILKLHVGSERAKQAHNRESQTLKK